MQAKRALARNPNTQEVNGYGRGPCPSMAKLCPFRKKKFAKIVTAKTEEKKTTCYEEWEEEFLECLEERCAAWTGNDCSRIYTTSRPETVSGENTEKNNIRTEQAGNEDNNNKSGDLVEADFKVLEVKETKTPGTVRAWCQHVETGKKGAVFAKNGAGKTLLESIRKEVRVKYRLMDNGTAFAVFVKAVS